MTGSSPEDAGVVILRVEALVGGDHAVEQPLAGVEAAQALHQPPVSWGHQGVRGGWGRLVRSLVPDFNSSVLCDCRQVPMTSDK